MDSSACGWIRSCPSAKAASRTRPELSASRPDSLLISTVTRAPSATSGPTGARRRRRSVRRLISLEPVVCGHDPAHQLVPNDVVIRQVTERDVLDVVQNPLPHAKPASGAPGEIDLRDVTGHHDLGAEAQPR